VALGPPGWVTVVVAFLVAYPGAPGQNGANGKDGQSFTSTALSPGDPNCATGGFSFTSASGTTYACKRRDRSGGAARLDSDGVSPDRDGWDGAVCEREPPE